MARTRIQLDTPQFVAERRDRGLKQQLQILYSGAHTMHQPQKKNGLVAHFPLHRYCPGPQLGLPRYPPDNKKPREGAFFYPRPKPKPGTGSRKW